MSSSRRTSLGIIRALVALTVVFVLGASPLFAADRGHSPRVFGERLHSLLDRLRDAGAGEEGGQEGGEVGDPGGTIIPDPGVADVDIETLASGVDPVPIEGVREGIAILRDADGIPHVFAYNRDDLYFGQGWAHASDRLFQMDTLRRQASGTLAELFGPPVLASDVELRTIGLRRAAVKSLEALSEESRSALAAYTAGVNAWVENNPLPLEYTLLELSGFEPWTELDSMAIAKLVAFSLSFNLDLGPTQNLLTYIAVGEAAGFNGQAAYFEDTFRTEPFGDRTTLGDSDTPLPYIDAPDDADGAYDLPYTAGTAKLVEDYLARASSVPLLARVLEGRDTDRGSNLWAVSGSLTESGRPMIANDPHLALDTPSTFYQVGLHVPRLDFEAVGSSFPGVQYLVQGQTRHISWGSTVNPLDETDVFQEQLVPDESSPSGLASLYEGEQEWVIPVPELYDYNVLDGVFDNLETAEPNGVVEGVFVPAATLILPRRMDGPILAFDQATGEAFSLQYTGFGPTRELDAFRVWLEDARSVDDFRAGLDYFDVGSQNWVVGDVQGNIAYFTSAELPIREDLQAGSVVGSPPNFVRSGQGGNEWAPVASPQPGQSTPYEILPFEEMPQTKNPSTGWFVNANNDPAGTNLDNNAFDQLRVGGGLYYIQDGYSVGNRAERITTRLVEAAADGSVTPEEMTSIQADVVLFDALVFKPYILAAFENAGEVGADPALVALAEDPRVVEAVERLSGWDGRTPTGVPSGYDASDADGVRLEPTQAEIDASIAATIYSVWRGQALANTIDATLDALQLPRPGGSQALAALRTLLERYPLLQGQGVSGLDFFNVEGVEDPADERDIVLLQSLSDALDLLAGEAFAPAFAMSTDQNDYRWGRLHRIVLDHPLGGPFNVPPAAGLILPSFEDLPGLAVDGGFDVPDASSHDPRAADAMSFMFGSGPVRRYVGILGDEPGATSGRTSLPGGSSGQPGNPWSVNILERWLTNDTYPVRQTTTNVVNALSGGEVLIPADPEFEPPIRIAPRALDRLGWR